MRKPRDFDAELAALAERTKHLRARKVQQLGELVLACGADALPIEPLAGALLATGQADPATKEAWRKAGAAFFQRARSAARGPGGNTRGNPASEGGHEPSSGEDHT
jgi:DNA-binding protein H-NS